MDQDPWRNRQNHRDRIDVPRDRVQAQQTRNEAKDSLTTVDIEKAAHEKLCGFTYSTAEGKQLRLGDKVMAFEQTKAALDWTVSNKASMLCSSLINEARGGIVSTREIAELSRSLLQSVAGKSEIYANEAMKLTAAIRGVVDPLVRQQRREQAARR